MLVLFVWGFLSDWRWVSLVCVFGSVDWLGGFFGGVWVCWLVGCLVFLLLFLIFGFGGVFVCAWCTKSRIRYKSSRGPWFSGLTCTAAGPKNVLKLDQVNITCLQQEIASVSCSYPSHTVGI